MCSKFLLTYFPMPFSKNLSPDLMLLSSMIELKSERCRLDWLFWFVKVITAFVTESFYYTVCYKCRCTNYTKLGCKISCPMCFNKSITWWNWKKRFIMPCLSSLIYYLSKLCQCNLWSVALTRSLQNATCTVKHSILHASKGLACRYWYDIMLCHYDHHGRGAGWSVTVSTSCLHHARSSASLLPPAELNYVVFIVVFLLYFH